MPCVAVEGRLVGCVVLCYVVFYCFLSFMLCALFNDLSLVFCCLSKKIHNMHFKLFLNDVSCFFSLLFELYAP